MIVSKIGFKRYRQRREFDLIHPLLRAAYFEMGAFVFSHTGELSIITSLIRHPDENKRIGGIKNSAHLFGRGGDSRVWNLPDDGFIEEMIAMIQTRFRDQIYIIRHNVRSGDHIHMNVTFSHAGKYKNIIYNKPYQKGEICGR